jgi:hypothetical protein
LEPSEPRTDLRWPIAIALGLLVVVLVNLAFVYVAVSGKDEVVPSYELEHR